MHVQVTSEAAMRLHLSDAIGEGQRSILLEPTPAGARLEATGTAQIVMRGARQRFRLWLEATADDGTTVLVFVNGQRAGRIVLSAGTGELDLRNDTGQPFPAGVEPVHAIGRIAVTDGAGTRLLEGHF